MCFYFLLTLSHWLNNHITSAITEDLVTLEELQASLILQDVLEACLQDHI